MTSNQATSRVVVTVEQRFDRTPDGQVWSSGPFTATFWARYLVAFDEVLVVARVRPVATPPKACHVVSSDRITFLPLPAYSGAGEFFRNAGAIRRLIADAIRPADSVILRVPSPIAACALPLLRRQGHPYAVEVVGDAYDVLSRGSYRHPFRPFLQWLLTREQKKQCGGAAAAAYVTRAALQARYPCHEYSVGISDVQLPDAAIRELRPFTTHYSSIELKKDAFVTPRVPDVDSRRFHLVTVGTLAQLYKAPDVLIRALGQCARGGLDAELTIVGDGQYRGHLEQLAASLDLTTRVHFAGHVSGPDAVRSYLDRADLFVLPSRQEGLPRAMIEAMARGLPCIGTRVGGIPELLAPEDLVNAGSVDELAQKIEEMARTPLRLFDAATKNFRAAKEYREDALAKKREEFYLHVRSLTECWHGLVQSTALERVA
jgi:glycosyltransferase involved in cell wall biosynthesis